MTRRSRSAPSVWINWSVRPSAKYSSAFSPPSDWKGSTAREFGRTAPLAVQDEEVARSPCHRIEVENTAVKTRASTATSVPILRQRLAAGPGARGSSAGKSLGVSRKEKDAA